MNNYTKVWKDFKENYKNIHIMLISLSIVAWFRGATGLIDYYIIQKPDNVRMLFIITFGAILFLYLDDFSLSELYNTGGGNSTNAAAGSVQSAVYPSFS